MRFPLFLTASFISLGGDWLTTIAVGVVLFVNTGSAAAPALFVLLRTVPRLFGPLVGGVLVDRKRADRAIASILVAQALVAGGLFLAVQHDRIVAIYATVVVSQFLGSAVRPMQQAMLPRLVAAEDVSRAAAVYGAGLGTTMFAAPALGVLLLRVSGPGLLVALDALTFLVAAAMLLAVGVHERLAPSGSMFAAATAGLRPVFADPVLRTAAGTQFGVSIAVGVVQGSLVVMAADRFGGADNSGALYAAVGIGSIVSALGIAARSQGRIGRDHLFGAAAVSIVILAATVAAHQLWVALILLGASALGSVRTDAWSASEFAYRVTHELLGRANAVLVLSGTVGVLLGAAAATVLDPLVGWPAAVFWTSVAALTATFLITITSGPLGEAAAGADGPVGHEPAAVR